MYLVFYLLAHLCITYMLHPRSLGPLNQSYRWLLAYCGCWESNSGPLKRSQVLSTPGPSLFPVPGDYTHTVCANELYVSLTHELQSSERRESQLRKCLRDIQL